MSLPPTILRYLPYVPLLAAPILLLSLGSKPTLPPSNRLPAPTDPGLASLPKDSRAREIYPEDWIEGGAYAELPNGRVRYWLVGPENGRKITLVHGLSIPALAYKKIVPMLVAAGFRVLLYDIYGRGYSDAPKDTPYDAKLYVTQLALLLQHVRWESTAVVGFSMGGVITAAFVSAFPDLVDREVVFISSVGAWEKGFPGKSFLDRVKSYFSTPPSDVGTLDEIGRLQSESLAGFSHAVQYSLSEGPVTRMHWAFKTPMWKGKRVFFMHGTHDPVVPPSFAPLLRGLVSEAQAGKGETQLMMIENGLHDVVWENPEEVGSALVEFLVKGR
ncbi:Alpha/Beta hydrolase protein [Roridomyces roridus]|uniref:Alpha/Beta hydrolase protein n=1 Tax=Roridomyces roridus TaxID=1738132 RepID=A0AAD7CCB3_9AGAR|nr:Alpha/Beta hydrolase protein [Roridomyces roridus]